MSNNHNLNKNNLPLSRKNVVFLKLMCYNIKYIDKCSNFLTMNFDLSSYKQNSIREHKLIFIITKRNAVKRGANCPRGLPHKM